MEETKITTGTCQFCGQSIDLAGAHATQEEDDMVATLADAVREGYIEGVTLKLADGVTAKLKPKDGMVVVSRTIKHEHQKTL